MSFALPALSRGRGFSAIETNGELPWGREGKEGTPKATTLSLRGGKRKERGRKEKVRVRTASRAKATV